MYLHLSTMSTWNYSDSTTFHSLSWILHWCRASCSLRKGTNPTFNSPLGLCLSMLNHWRICNSITSLYPAIHDMCRIYQRCQSWQHFNFRIFQSFPSLPDSVRISWRQNKVNKGTVLELYYIRKIYCGVVPFQSSYLGRLGRLGPIYGR
jgi:hypothetical protein